MKTQHTGISLHVSQLTITILLPHYHLQSENISYFTRFTGFKLHHINYTHYSTVRGSSWPSFNRFDLGWANQNINKNQVKMEHNLHVDSVLIILPTIISFQDYNMV